MHRHPVEPGVKLYTPREESSPIPLKSTDVTSATHTTLDVMQESRIDDYWDIVGTRDLSELWLAFTQSASMKEKPPDGYTWPGRRLTKQPATSRPEHLWPEIWRSMSKNSKMIKKQNWANEKPILENAWRLRGIYFMDLDDNELIQGDHQDCTEKVGSPALAMPCKRTNSKHGVTRSKNDDQK